MRSVLATATRTHPAIRKVQNSRLATKIVDVLTPEYEFPPPLPMAQEMMNELQDVILLLPTTGMPVLSNKGQQTWFNISRRLLELVQHADEHKYYITLNVQVYLSIMLSKAKAWEYDQARLNQYHKRTMQLCNELRELVASDNYQAGSVK